MRRLALLLLPWILSAQFHRAEQDREIHYWLLAPDTHQFRISHDFTVSRPGQKYVHSFVRKGSVVTKSIVSLVGGGPFNRRNVMLVAAGMSLCGTKHWVAISTAFAKSTFGNDGASHPTRNMPEIITAARMRMICQ